MNHFTRSIFLGLLGLVFFLQGCKREDFIEMVQPPVLVYPSDSQVIGDRQPTLRWKPVVPQDGATAYEVVIYPSRDEYLVGERIIRTATVEEWNKHWAVAIFSGKIDSLALASYYDETTGEYAYTVPDPLDFSCNTQYYWAVRGISEFEYFPSTAETFFVGDTEAPEPTLVNPYDEQVIRGGIENISGVLADNIGVASYEIFINKYVHLQDSTGAYMTDGDSDPYIDDNGAIRAECQDQVCVVDSHTYVLRLDGAAIPTYTQTDKNGNLNSLSVDHDFGTLPPGRHTITLRACDGVSGCAPNCTEHTITVLVEEETPSVEDSPGVTLVPSQAFGPGIEPGSSSGGPSGRDRKSVV